MAASFDEHIFREARVIALCCTLPSKAAALEEASGACREVFDRFNISASRTDFQLLVGLWTRMLLAMDDCGPWLGKGPPDPDRLAHSDQAVAKDVAAVLASDRS
jgi:hypothetical protein